MATTDGLTESTSTAAVAQISSYFDLSIALILSYWPALTLAVQNQWGGPDSADKRDWLAGAISDLFAERPETDQEDVEDVLLQVMSDEFEVQVEDESEVQVARDIMKARKATIKGDFAEIEALRKRWAERKGKEQQVQVTAQETSEEEYSEDDDEDGGVDVEMGEAPPLVPAKAKPPPEVDEDGFTTVVSKKKK